MKGFLPLYLCIRAPFFIQQIFKITYFCKSNDRYIFFFNLFIGCVGSSVCARAFPSYGKWGPLLIAVRGPLFIAVRGPPTIAAPPAAGHRLQMRRPSSRGPRAQLLRSTWDPPRPGPEPVSPALAGRPPTTAPPGKPSNDILILLASLPFFFFFLKRFI